MSISNGQIETSDRVERAIAAYRDAAAANRATNCRSGSVIALTAENSADVMITADLHGDRDRFERILELAALDEHPKRHLILQEVCHGGPTYPGDGGCMSHRLLEDVALLKSRFPERVHFLLSNHELAELTEYPIMKGGKLLNLTFRLGLAHAFAAAADNVRTAICEFLRSCPLAVRVPASRLFIAHSLPSRVDKMPFDATVFEREPRASDLKEFGPVFELVWGRDFREDNAAAFAKAVDADWLITGHEPCAAGFATPNSRQLILDCCGEKACYLLLTTQQPQRLEDVKTQVAPLDAVDQRSQNCGS